MPLETLQTERVDDSFIYSLILKHLKNFYLNDPVHTIDMISLYLSMLYTSFLMMSSTGPWTNCCSTSSCGSSDTA